MITKQTNRQTKSQEIPTFIYFPQILFRVLLFLYAHIKTHSKKKDVLVTIILQETKNSNLFNKNCTQEYVKNRIQHEES